MRRLAHQCTAVTKSNKRCSITSESALRTESGKLACAPLLRGGKYCLFHCQIFNSYPARVFTSARVFYLDFETTGLDVLNDSIVEIGVLDELSGAVFSTVVCPSTMPSGDETSVHGISLHELSEGPVFAEAFRRLLRFIQNVVEMSVVEDSDSSMEETVEGCL